MFGFLAAAVAVLAFVTGFNLLLCFAIIRRLRAAVGSTGVERPARDADLPAIGTVVAPFAMTAVDGSPVTQADFAVGESFVGLLQPGCPACTAFVDSLESGAITMPERTVFMVALAGAEETGAYAARLSKYARAFVSTIDGPDLVAFGEPGVFPTFLRIVNGVVTDADPRADVVLKGMRARAAR